MQHKNAKSKAEFWSSSGIKPFKQKYSNYQTWYKFRRQGQWSNPFEVRDTLPIVLKDMVVGPGKELGEMTIDMRFTKADLERYDELNKTPDFMTACKGPEANLKLLDLLALDIRMLLSCDPLAQKGKNEIPEDSSTPDEAGGAVLPEAASDADHSDPGSALEDPQQTLPEPQQTDDSDYLRWVPYSPMLVRWTEQGLTDPTAIGSSKFFPACAFFFYIDALAKAHPDINNALHKAWLAKFKTPMSAADLDKPPDTFNDEAKQWYTETINYMQDKLTDVERGLRGLPMKELPLRRARTKASEKAAANERASAAKHPAQKRTASSVATDSDDEELSMTNAKR